MCHVLLHQGGSLHVCVTLIFVIVFRLHAVRVFLVFIYKLDQASLFATSLNSHDLLSISSVLYNYPYYWLHGIWNTGADPASSSCTKTFVHFRSSPLYPAALLLFRRKRPLSIQFSFLGTLTPSLSVYNCCTSRFKMFLRWYLPVSGQFEHSFCVCATPVALWFSLFSSSWFTCSVR